MSDGTVMTDNDERVSILVVDDHATFAEALRHALDAEPDLHVVATLTNSAAAEEAAIALRPDVALIDRRIGQEDGIELARVLHRSVPDTKLLMLTASADEATLIGAIEAGCDGFLMKEAPLDSVLAAVRSAARGDAVITPAMLARLLPRMRARDQPTARSGALTDRESAVLRLLAEGRSNAAIAKELIISVNTVRNHVQGVLTKLGAHSKLEAVAKARAAGLLGSDLAQ